MMLFALLVQLLCSLGLAVPLDVRDLRDLHSNEEAPTATILVPSGVAVPVPAMAALSDDPFYNYGIESYEYCENGKVRNNMYFVEFDVKNSSQIVGTWYFLLQENLNRASMKIHGIWFHTDWGYVSRQHGQYHLVIPQTTSYH